MPLPQFTLSSAGSRAQELYSRLHAAIWSGELLPGERLVEQALAARYEVSRTPVREALHRLSVDGLVETGALGTVVRQVTLAELEHMFQIREVLEGLSSRLAAQTRSSLDVSLLRETLGQLTDATRTGEPELVGQIGRRLRELTAEIAGNPRLAKELDDLRGFVNRLQGSAYSADGMLEVAAADYTAIVDAIEAGDAELAESRTREHFRTIATIRLLRARQRRPLV